MVGLGAEVTAPWKGKPCASSPGPVCPPLLKILFCAQTLRLKRKAFSQTLIPGLRSSPDSTCPFGEFPVGRWWACAFHQKIPPTELGVPTLVKVKESRQPTPLFHSQKRSLFSGASKRKITLSTAILEVTLLVFARPMKTRRSTPSPQFALP